MLQVLPSLHQSAIWRNFGIARTDLAVIARAGTGKTTTIVEGLRYLPYGKVLVCAFNVEIRDELLERVKERNLKNVKVLSLHGLGFATLKKYPQYATTDLDKLKGMRISRQVLGDLDPKKVDIRELADAVRAAASLAKVTLTTDPAAILELVKTHDVGDGKYRADTIARYAQQACEIALKEMATIDFDDMIWIPAHLNLTPPQYNYVIVDEAQDMSLAQLRLAQRARLPGGRMIVVGDPKQAIYGWRGADEQAMPRMVEELAAETLPLTVSYRCPHAVINLARRYVPDIEAAPNAQAGAVHNIKFPELIVHAQPGDFVLSRSNAPLTEACGYLLRSGIRARVVGQDIGLQLKSLLQRSRARTLGDLRSWLAAHKAKETERLKDRESARFTALDTIDSLDIIAAQQTDLLGVHTRLDQMFLDEKADQRALVSCSTVHKAKGRERDNVFLLQDTFFRWPGKEEENVYYVAVTRARQNLYLVSGLKAA